MERLLARCCLLLCLCLPVGKKTTVRPLHLRKLPLIIIMHAHLAVLIEPNRTQPSIGHTVPEYMSLSSALAIPFLHL